MADAEFFVAFAGPYVTYQDSGRIGQMRFGVPASGPMDRLSFDAGNAALGNPHGQTGIEVSLGGIVLTCTQGTVSLAITGGDFVVEHAGHKMQSWCVLTISNGERLTIRAGRSGSWAYVTFAGALTTSQWLGATATHSTSGFGGGVIKTGDRIVVRDSNIQNNRIGEIAMPDRDRLDQVRVVIGPQDRYFKADAVERLLSEPFEVTDAYDRMGMRLRGSKLALDGALSIPSEPIVRGSIQVSGDGVPTVLLADHQTTGGYPKIATVISCDTDVMTQLRSGDALHFSAITPQDAIGAVRHYDARRRAYLATVSVERGSLDQRLMRENLIHAAQIDDS